jgi:hypothetical protein
MSEHDGNSKRPISPDAEPVSHEATEVIVLSNHPVAHDHYALPIDHEPQYGKRRHEWRESKIIQTRGKEHTNENTLAYTPDDESFEVDMLNEDVRTYYPNGVDLSTRVIPGMTVNTLLSPQGTISDHGM